MSLKDNDPYRLWVYSLRGEVLMAAMSASIPVNQWPLCGFSREGAGNFMEYLGWPLKMYQGTLNLSRTSAGNLDYRWNASWSREVYGPSGSADDPLIMRDYADGADAVTALSRLWLLAVENMRRETKSKNWSYHFVSYMRSVACPIRSDQTTPPQSATD